MHRFVAKRCGALSQSVMWVRRRVLRWPSTIDLRSCEHAACFEDAKEQLQRAHDTRPDRGEATLLCRVCRRLAAWLVSLLGDVCERMQDERP